MSKEDLIRAAIEWAENGIPVFPCSADKSPLTKNGHKDAESDPKKVRAMFEFWGDTVQMIGGRMGDGIFAVDVDLYKGGAPKEWLDDQIANGSIVDTRTHKTKSGGLHFIYEGDVNSCVPASGVEVKGEGGYIILPGSPGYTTQREGIVPAPPSLIESLRATFAGTRGSSVTQLEAAIMSGRSFHEALTQLAAKLAAQGQDQIVIQERLIRLLKASTASEPGHERHARWRSLMADKGGELSRISSSAYYKFNDEAIMQEAGEMAGADMAELLDVTGDIFTQLGNFEPTQKEVKQYDEDKWPFDGDGYFAHETHDLTNTDFVLYPIFAENETAVLFAEPKTGKTALALSSALHIACGMDFGALKVSEAGSCLYYALEGSRAIRLRVAAWKKRMGEKDVQLPEHIPLFVVERPANLLKENIREETAAQIIAASKYLARQGNPPLKAIYIDTLTKAMAGGDQNSVEDTSELFEIVNLIRAGGVSATIVFVHHKARQGHVRGSSNIEAEPDILIDVSKKNDIVSMKIARARSIEDGATYHFHVESVDLGTTKQGHVLKGMFVEPIEGMMEDRQEDPAEVQLIAQRRTTITQLGESPTAADVVKAWFEAGLLRGKTVRGADVAPNWTSAECQEALHKVANDVGGTIFGDFVIRPVIADKNVISFKVGKASF